MPDSEIWNDIIANGIGDNSQTCLLLIQLADWEDSHGNAEIAATYMVASGLFAIAATIKRHTDLV